MEQRRLPLLEPITLTFASGGSVSFQYSDEVNTFLQGERSAWGAMASAEIGPSMLRAGVGSQIAHLSVAGDQLDAYNRALADTGMSDEIRSDIFGLLSNSLRKLEGANYVYSKSPVGLRILDKQSSDRLAAHAALTAAVVPLGQLSSDVRQLDPRILAAAQYFLNTPTSADIGDATLEKVAENWAHRFATQQEEARQTIADIKLELTRLETDIAEKRQELARRQEESDKQLSDHGATLKGIQAHYNEQMLLRAPAEYWQIKYEGHRDWAIWCFIAMALVISAILYGSYLIAPWSLELINLYRGEEATGWVGEIALITVPALAAFWLLKALSRIFAQQTQRMGDALERNTMIKTYLALSAEPSQPIQAAERLVILQALFRPGPDDPPDNEGSASMLESLHNLTGGKAR